MDISDKRRACAAALTLSLVLLTSGTSVAAENDSGKPSGEDMLLDAVAVRPLTLAASAVGLAAWVVTLPFTVPSGGALDAGQSWVVEPLEYTFIRPLGEISGNR